MMRGSRFAGVVFGTWNRVAKLFCSNWIPSNCADAVAVVAVPRRARIWQYAVPVGAVPAADSCTHVDEPPVSATPVPDVVEMTVAEELYQSIATDTVRFCAVERMRAWICAA